MRSVRLIASWATLCLALLGASSSAGASLGGDFTLQTSRGEKVSLSSFKGKVVMLYFGFTHCPEMCPTELLQFQKVLSLLPPEKRAQVQPLFVSVDPKRDTAEVLDPYVRNFGTEIIALTGDEKELHKITKQYGAQFRYVPSGSSYTVDHTVNTYLIDTQGKLARIVPYGTPTEEMLKQVQKLLP